MEIEEIGAFEAKTRLSELLAGVCQGKVYRITRRGKPIAELRPLEMSGNRLRFGSDRGKIRMRADFDKPLSDFRKYTR